MKLLHFVLVCCVAACIFVSCTDSEESHPAANDEQAMIDNQIARIDLSPQEIDDYCDAKNRIDDLRSLAKSEASAKYVRGKQAELLRILNEHAHKLLVRNANSWLSEEKRWDAVRREIRRRFGDEWEIVSSTSSEPTVEYKTESVVVDYAFSVTLKDHVFLGPNNYLTKTVHLNVTAYPSCDAAVDQRIVASHEVQITD